MRWPPLPPRMIERATRLRLAGDWPAACAAAGFNVRLDVDAVARDLGLEVATRLEADLRHLAPDLLRWHLPRRSPGGPLRPRLRFPLALFPGSRALIARTPSHPADPQRVSLTFERLDRVSRIRRDDVLLLLRDRWDSRCTAEKLSRSGGLTRLPFFTATGERLPEEALGGDSPEGRVERAVRLDDAGRHADAWAEGGYELIADPVRALAALRPIHATLEDSRRRVLGYLAQTRNMAEPRPAPTEVDERTGQAAIDLYGRTLVLDGRRARLVNHDLPRVPRIPLALAGRPPELTALLRGELHPSELHPLAHAALFPAAGPIAPAGPRFTPLRETIHVRCESTTHEIRYTGGSFVVPHPEPEFVRERALTALGGRMQGCAAAVDGWRDPSIRLPGPMADFRDELLRYFAGADTAAVEVALDRGLDPHVRDDRGRTLVHLLAWLPDADLLPRLLAAGLDVDALDRYRRTPLRLALDYGSPELVRALVAAGASRTVF